MGYRMLLRCADSRVCPAVASLAFVANGALREPLQWQFTRSDFEREHGSLWDHIAAVLTGLSLEQLATLEGYLVYDLREERTVHDSQATVAV